MGGHCFSSPSRRPAISGRPSKKEPPGSLAALSVLLLERTFQIERNPSSASGFGKPKYQK